MGKRKTVKAIKSQPPRLRRQDSFLGIHFDLHARAGMRGFGKGVTDQMVQAIIDQARPDYIQCDCKGHPGIASYPTKVGYHVAGFAKDQLRIWRRVTAASGVALYMHYSGVLDTAAVQHHPSWSAIGPDGKPYTDPREGITSTFGPYADKLLIPQLKELADDYDVDGVWVDGECWGTERDYRKEALEAFARQTGIRSVPRSPQDPHWQEFSDFCREAFRRYLRHYVDELHSHKPSFQVASNWAFSSFMPEPVSADVDFISGDYSLQNSVNSARFEGRLMCRQGKAWDLMAWAFARKWDPSEKCNCTKSPAQLQQEAAVVLALGGGFQAYFRQTPDGSIHDWEMKLMAEVARFCRARQKVCHKAQAVPQVAVLYSKAGLYRRMKKLFGPWSGETTAVHGILRSLLESQYSVELLAEHNLAGRMHEYPIIIVPEWDYLEPQFIQELLEYVRAGGSLLAVGPAAAAMFQKPLKARLLGEAQTRTQWLEHGCWLAGMQTVSQDVRLGRGAREFGRLYDDNDTKGPHRPAASIAALGKGRLAATYVNFGERYVNAATGTARGFLAALVRELFPSPMVEVRGSQHVDVQVNRIEGKLAVNLVNTAGPHADGNVYVYDEIPPIGPLEVVIRTGRRPRSVRLEPGGSETSWKFSAGKVRLTLPRLEIHNVIVIG